MPQLKLIVRDNGNAADTTILNITAGSGEVYQENKKFLFSLAKFLNTAVKENFVALVEDDNQNQVSE